FSERNDAVMYQARQIAEGDTPSSIFDASGVSSVVALDGTRMGLWTFALSAGVANLPLGIGIANMPSIANNGWRAHNTALTVFLELGIPGLIAMLTLAIVAGRSVWRLIVQGLRSRNLGMMA